MIREKTIKTLEFDKILQKIAVFAASETARADILSLRPLESVEKIEEALTELSEADLILFEHSVNPSLSFDDATAAIERAEVFSLLTAGEILKIERVLRIARNLQAQILKVPDEKIVRLKRTASELYVNIKLEEDISSAIISETEIADCASSELRAIRQKIKKIAENIKTKLNSYVNSPAFSKFMQDNIVTVRNDRYVVPLKAEFKGALPGLIHDQSASGSTLYVEPMAIVEMNNDLKTQILAEEAEIERILRDFTSRIGAEAGLIKFTFKTITHLDAVFAKARYCQSVNAVRPIFDKASRVDIQSGRHPLIDAKRVVPNSVRVGGEFNMLIVTGPNTGGKTVCLKLVGLLEIMGMSGLFVPATQANLAFFDDIFCDIGDEQSIEQSLSTFSSHMKNAVSIIQNLTKNSLVLLDELGAGTDPAEGAALALSIAGHILNIGACAVITTHYNEFKEFAVTTKGVQNASMDFDITTYSPTYRLNIGAPGASNALLIAEKLGLKKEITERARQILGGQKAEFNNVLMSLEKSRRDAIRDIEVAETLRKEAETERNSVKLEREKLFQQRERLNQAVKKETKRLVESAMEEANEIIEKLRETLTDPSEKNLFEAQRLRKSLKKYIINEENEFQVHSEEEGGDFSCGDRVLIVSLNSEGDIVSVNPVKGEAKVTIGSITGNFPLTNLKRLKRGKKEREQLTPTKMTLFNERVSGEINLIGKASDEAIYLLEEHFDRAIRAKLTELRIIHGYGEGILRKAVQAFLRSKKDVATFRDGNFNEGGKGVTVAVFK